MSVTSLVSTQVSRTFARLSREKVRLLIVLAVVAGSPLIGYSARPAQLNYLLLGFIALLASAIYLRKPVLGIVSILVTGIFISYLGPGGINATILLVMALPFLWVLESFGIRAEFRLAVSRVMPPIYVLMILSALAFVMGLFPWFMNVDPAPLDAQAGGFAIYMLSFVAFFITANQIRNLDDLQKLTGAFLILGAVYVIATGSPGVREYTLGWFGSSGSLFWLWLVALAYSMALFNTALPARWRLALLVLVGVTMYVLFVQRFDNKSGWVPAFFILWVITWLRSWKLGLFTLVAGIGAAAYLYTEIYGTEGYSLATRLELLPIMWQIFLANPMFGVGFGSYHFYSQLFAIRGWYVPLNSHNNYIDIFMQTGIVGALAFAWFVVEVSGLLWRLFKNPRVREEEPFSRAYVNAAIGGFAGMLLVGMLGDWFLPFVYNIGLSGFRASVMSWVFLGGLVAIERNLAEKEAQKE